MKYPNNHCDFYGKMGADHTEPVEINERTHTAYLSHEAYNHMMALQGNARQGDTNAVDALDNFWGIVVERVKKRERL